MPQSSVAVFSGPPCNVCVMQTFIKTMNYTHLMPTRYNLSDVDLKKVIAGDALESAEKKLAAKKVWPA